MITSWPSMSGSSSPLFPPRPSLLRKWSRPPSSLITVYNYSSFFSSTNVSIITNWTKTKRVRKSRTSVSSPGTNALPVPSLADLENLDSEEFPALRTFENDLGRLSVIGDVSLQQALAAASADGGRAADEHLSAGLSVMVVETVFPGHPGEHSTVATRLFLPARKVKEKVKKLRSSLTADILSDSNPNTILAMTFRQVVIQRLWSFELALFQRGSGRDMNDLGNPREAPFSCTLSASREKVLSVLAEAICICALENMKEGFLHNKLGISSRRTFNWFKKFKRFTSTDSSVCVYQFSDKEIMNSAKRLADVLKPTSGYSVPKGKRVQSAWWPSRSYLQNVDSEFDEWVQEYVPAYKLQVDGNKLESVKCDGWQECGHNRWEILLSHSQMVELADILDMYYEDPYTMPYKSLQCKAATLSSNNLKTKRKFSFWRLVFSAVATGCVLVIINILGKIYFPGFWKSWKLTIDRGLLTMQATSSSAHQPSSDTDDSYDEDNSGLARFSSELGWLNAFLTPLSSRIELSPVELEKLYCSVVGRIKDGLGWKGSIAFHPDIGAWTGKVPSCLGQVNGEENFHEGIAPIHDESSENTISRGSDSTHAKVNEFVQAPLGEDIANYELTLSRDAKVVGLKPTNLVAVNHWAENPLASELPEGRKLSPGVFEPGVKVQCPEESILLELLISFSSPSRFALVRPLVTVR